MSALKAAYPDKPSQGKALRRPFARIVIFLAKGFGVLLLLCVLALGGGLYWLRTPAAEKLILDETSKALAVQGMTFTASRLSGPLPQRLAIEDFSLADAQGPILKAARAEVRWNMAALLTGTVLVETVELDQPEVFRLPAPAPDKPDETPPASSGSFSLPVEIRLDALRLQGGRIHAAVLKPEAGPDGPVLALAVSGSAAASSSGLAATLRCEVRHPEHGGLSLDLQLTSGLDAAGSGGPEDTLTLNVAGDETPGGILTLLLDKPDLPAYRLRLNGSGGLKDWRGKLTLLAGKAETPDATAGGRADSPAEPAMRPDVLDVSVDVGLQCATGSLLNDLAVKPAFSLRLAAEAKPGERTPPSLLPLLGGGARADLELSAVGKRHSLKADAGASAWQVQITEAEIQPDAKTDSQALKATIQAILSDPAAFAGGSGNAASGKDGAGGKNHADIAAGAARGDSGPASAKAGHPEARPIPLQRAAVTAAITGSLGATENRLNLKSTLEAQTRDRTFAIPCNLEAEARGRHFSLRRLDVSGLGIKAEAAADFYADSGAAKATAEILAADKAEWQTLISQLAGFDNPSDAGGQTAEGQNARAALGGELRLNASLDLPGRSAAPASENADGGKTSGNAPAGTIPTTGNATTSKGTMTGSAPAGNGLLRLTGSGMRWPTAQLAGMLGSSLNVSARLTAGENGANVWTVVLEEAKAGIFSASGKASFTPPARENSASTDITAARGLAANNADSKPPDGKNGAAANKKNDTPPLASGAAGSESSPAAAGRLEADLKAGVSDLAPLGPGLGGALSATVKASGPLNALNIQAGADSAALSTPSGVFHGLSLRLAAHSAMTPARPVPQSRTGAPPAQAGSKNTANTASTAGAGSTDNLGKSDDMALKGDLALKAADSPGGPISLSGRWQADLPADGRTVSASLDDFLVQGAGVKLSASLAALVAQAAPPSSPADGRGTAPAAAALPVSLKGEVNADVEDWNKIAALSGVPLSGGPARARLHLDNAGGGQSASLDLTLQSLLLKDAASGQAAFSVEDAAASLVLPRVSPDKALAGLAPDFRLRLGRGLAGPLRWSGGMATVKGQAGAGEFALSLSRAARDATPAARAKQGQAPTRPASSGAGPADLLDVRGRYDLNRQEAVLNALALSVPPQSSGSGPNQAGAGLRLRKPLTVKFADGVQFAGLDMAFQPGGRLSADASVAPGLMRLKADLQALPFSFFALFTDAPMPGGELRLTADLSSSAQGPRGSVSLQSRISPARSRTGLVKSDAQADAPNNTGSPAGVNSPADAGVSGSAGAPVGAPAPADAFDLRITANLVASPGTSAAPGSGVRSLPGYIWLNGSGNFGKASASDNPKEGRLAFQIPLRLSPDGAPLPDSRAPMAASLHWDGSVASLWQAVPLPDRYLSGNALLDLAVTGSLDAPKPTMTAYLGQGRFQDITTGVLLTDIKLEAKLTPDGNLNALVSAGDGQKGTLALEAALRGLLDQKAPLLAVRGQLNNLSPLHRDDLSISLSGIFGVKGPADVPAVTADIRVDQGEFTLSSALGGSITTLDVTPGPLDAPGPGAKDAKAAGAQDAGTKNGGAKTSASSGKAQSDAKQSASPASSTAKAGQGKRRPAGKTAAATTPPAASSPAVSGPSLDVRISLPRQFFIRGMGLDSEWEGDLRISGPASDPSLTGALRPVRGQLDILSKTFAFTGGDISFTGGMRINPLLNLELTYEGPSVTAIVRATGSAKKPQLVLESRPPLPRDEILAQVLFGKRTSDLSRFEALQLANSLRELSNAGGSSLDVLTGIRKTVGLDVLRVGSQDKADQRATSGQSGDSNLTGPKDDQNGTTSAPTLEAGKYINDSIYIGVEQGATPDSTGVRVEVELFPSVNLQGKSSATATEVGVGWKKDY